MKPCPTCGERPRIRSYCRECEREYRRETMRARYRTNSVYRVYIQRRDRQRAIERCERTAEQQADRREWTAHIVALARKRGYSFQRLSTESGVCRRTLSRIATDPDFVPKPSTERKLTTFAGAMINALSHSVR